MGSEAPFGHGQINGHLGAPVIRSKPPRTITEPLSQSNSALNIVIDGQRVRPPSCRRTTRSSKEDWPSEGLDQL